ncbi:SMI1/KNR4 family protein [Marinobacterium stanieri]|uniref:SMI1/KNR4 family protein n=1 Tax=Marinobacterium stanieri TaxID=49186 RepID=UPI000970FADA|nr:SMI1/KNR4 family protein [Marinobacterium stanieri]
MISEESKKIILEIWKAREPGISYPPASKEQIEDFEDVCREVPEDYKWFLLNCGGGVIGSEWVDGIDELHSTHTKFDEE